MGTLVDVTVPAVGMPHRESVHAAAQNVLRDIIKEQCPNLVELQATLTLPEGSPDYSDYVSTALLSNVFHYEPKSFVGAS